MTKNASIITRMVPALLALACLLLLLAPRALAAEGATGTDQIAIGSDGTVTLISGHIAGEGVASVQFTLNVGEGNTFTPAASLGERLTYASGGAGTITVYVAGAEALMPMGTNQVVLGTVAGDLTNVSVQPDSLQYVYGRNVITKSVSPGAQGPAQQPASDLQAALDNANAQYGGNDPAIKERYTPGSWDALQDAISNAQALLAAGATEQEQAAALDALLKAISGLEPVARKSLDDAIAAAETVDGSGYTADSFAALQAALENAKALRDKPDATDEEWAAAAAQLLAAKDKLVLQAAADTAAYDPGASAGSGDGAAAPTATPAATSAPAVKRAPNTGDEAALVPWAMALVLCAAALAAVGLRRGRARR